MNIIVLDGYGVNPGDLSWDFLKKFGNVTVCDKTPQDEAAEVARDAEVIFTNRIAITKELLDACPKIRYISALGTGYDMIDLAACAARSICVCNAPGYSSDSVAQLAFTLILNLTSDINGIKDITASGQWPGLPGFRYDAYRFTELAGMTLGLIGCGAIGRRVAEMAAAFHLKILATTKSRTSGAENGIIFTNIDDLLAKSDIISIHCPLNNETRTMVDSSFISKMKPGAFLINTARGAILNELDVAAALRSGMLAGAGLDVLAEEPANPQNPLLTAPNCIITPHIAWATVAARKRLLKILENNLESFIETGNGINVII